jgi:hypothetical protein
MQTSDLSAIASAFWAEYVVWTWRIGPESTYEVMRADTVIEAAPTMSDAKSRCTALRRLAAAKAVLLSGVVVLAEDTTDRPTELEKADYLTRIADLTEQRDRLLVAFLQPYKDLPDDFLRAVASGHKTSVDITVILAEAILAGRALDLVQ